MSTERFLEYLQQLITMVDKKDRYSIALAKNALSATVELAFASKKSDPRTLRVMRAAEESFYNLIDHQSEFAGKPGNPERNRQKRQQLLLTLYPGC